MVAPRTPTELALTQVFSSTLLVDRVSLHDDFFSLGGDSIVGMRLVALIRSVLGLELPLRELFTHPRLDALAAWLDAHGRGTAQSAEPIPLVSRDTPLPLSFAQQRLWFFDQLQPRSPLYNFPIALHLRGALDRETLGRALTEILARHEALRTCFPVHDGTASQCILAAPAQMPLPLFLLRDTPQESVHAQLIRLATQEASTPFDLATGPLFRAFLLQLAQDHHVLLVTMHHIVSDGWSIGILGQELSALYSAFLRQLPSPLPPLAVQLADFSEWEHAQSTGPHFLAQLAYWQTQLKDCQPLELPTDRPRPPVFSYQGRSVPLALPKALTASLKHLSTEHGATLFMTLVAAWNLLLSRYSGQTDLCVGTPIAHRTRTETEPLIGFFVNTLVLRTHVEPEQSFTDLLSQVRKTCLDAYAHQDVPFERLVESLSVARDLSRNPLFQVMLVLQNAPLSALSLPGLAVEPLELDSFTAKFELTLSLGEEDDGSLRGSLEYARDLWEPATIERLTDQWVTLLGALVASPKAALHTLQLLTEAERHHLLVTWNDTASDFPQDLCIHQLFEQQVEHTPDAVALVFEDQQLTYRELNARANQLAHHLRSLGVGPEVLVALCVERSLEMVIGLLGILKAGGAYVPLDPRYPKDRLAYIIDDTRSVAIVGQRTLRGHLPALTVPFVQMDEPGQWADQSQDNPPSLVSSHSLAYVIYTSGSTGTPKGVCIEHRSVCNLVSAQRGWLGIRPGSSVLQFASLSFDAAVWEIFVTLCSGATLHLGRAEIAQNPTELGRWLHQRQIEIATLPPAVLPWLSPQSTASLATLVVAGEVCPPALAAKWLTGRRVLNAYGPTEITVCASIAQCSPDVLPPNIGRPIANVQMYILDAYLQPVPIGVPGELHIGGVGLARGYLNRPELTQQKFIANPFSSQPRARLYKSGDLARYLPDGHVEFLGRIDHQVKVRGFRIEPGEIEAALRATASVTDAVVVAAAMPDGSRELVAYYVPIADPAAAESSLRAQLQTKLPDFMMPTAFVPIAVLPLTSNGKVDRQALSRRTLAPRRTESEYEPPQNKLEQQIALIWREVLQAERVGIHDNFFDLGGQSLKMAQVHARLRDVLGREISLILLFQYPTISTLAGFLQGESGRDTEVLSRSQARGRLSKQAAARQSQFAQGRRKRDE